MYQMFHVLSRKPQKRMRISITRIWIGLGTSMATSTPPPEQLTMDVPKFLNRNPLDMRLGDRMA